MVLRLVNLVVACWALHISPSLCLAGVLTHPCGSLGKSAGVTACHGEKDHARTDSRSGTCTHEENCNSDPCQESPVVKDGGDQTFGVATFLPALPGVSLPEISLARVETHSYSDASPNLPRLSLHQSDLPLLI